MRESSDTLWSVGFKIFGALLLLYFAACATGNGNSYDLEQEEADLAAHPQAPALGRPPAHAAARGRRLGVRALPCHDASRTSEGGTVGGVGNRAGIASA